MTASMAEGQRNISWFLNRPPGEELAIEADWPAMGVSDWAWGGATGAGARVCVMDSGVDPGHPMVGGLAGAYAVDPVTQDIVPDDSGDSCGHGTACASVIRRMAPKAAITSMQVLGGVFGTGDTLIAGLRWAVMQGFDVINLSLSTTKARFTGALRELVDDAYFDRTLIVASAHNMRVESFPWRFASVVSVGSHLEPDPWIHYYNPQPPVELYAHGVNVHVAWRDGGETKCSGNSFATPHIAGLCALIRSKHPSLTPFQVKTLLYLTAANVRSSHDAAGRHPD